ncbi:response regulator transcription factor [Salinifilum aidingensis]
MSPELLCLTREASAADVLPGLGLLPHRSRVSPPDPQAVLSPGAHDVVVVDARKDMAGARELCRLLSAGSAPVLAVVSEGGLVAVNGEWGVDDILLPAAGPAEVDARLRLLAARRETAAREDDALAVGDLVIEEATYTARLKGRALELTYKEFELLKFFAQHPGRVFSRAQLLQEVWGYDFFGGTRTVDVHVRRLRAKLGPEHDSMIGTVRSVGYKFVTPQRGRGTERGRRADGVIGAEEAGAAASPERAPAAELPDRQAAAPAGVLDEGTGSRAAGTR